MGRLARRFPGDRATWLGLSPRPDAKARALGLRAACCDGRLGAVPLHKPNGRDWLLCEPYRPKRINRTQLRHARRAERPCDDDAHHRLRARHCAEVAGKMVSAVLRARACGHRPDFRAAHFFHDHSRRRRL